ncbi:Sulfatase [Posidoniimonas polymericola]|uniref:Sulfatase n=1 Tax=Posidoniimonas polymericola TaxID=2528002 RepID=A0A5C5YV10_9BACT|nr:sulfatase/phosphatase domain-containing protein [Posidoniimonas polymericola]TWT78377.1 Sulfatase [Posidoniimonas polymericola]
MPLYVPDNETCRLDWAQYLPGIRVPLIVKWPSRVAAGGVRNDLVSMLDVTATIVDAAVVKCPDTFDGRPLWGAAYEQRDCVFAARDSINEVHNPMRCVRTQKFKYIRNFAPELGYWEGKYYEKNRPMLPEIRMLAAAGQLTPSPELILKATAPAEDLYDLYADPHEVNNLAASPIRQATRSRLRTKLDRWIVPTGDTGLERWHAEGGGGERVPAGGIR